MLFRGHMLIVILMVKKLSERFTKKNLKETNQEELTVEKLIKRKVIKYTSNEKGMIILLIAGLIKKYHYIK